MLAPRALPLALLVLAACDPTLPAAPPHANVAPAPHPPPMGLCWLEYARDAMPGSYGLAGASAHEQWELTYSGLLVRHPRGDLLVDAGNSSHFSEEVETAGFVAGFLLKSAQGGHTVALTEALRRAGEDPAQLDGIALSHVHADHAGGVMDLPKTPVLLSAEELAFAAREKDSGGFHVVQAHARSIEARAKPIAFTKTPYENFDRSADLHGDGSIVFVPLFGHTPGSIGTFVNLSPTVRFFHAGDAVNTLEAIEKRRGKSVLLEVTDHDGAAADAIAAKLNQLHAQDPALVILPAHDRRAWKQAFGAPGSCLGPLRP